MSIILIETGFSEPWVLEWWYWRQQITFSPTWFIFTQEILILYGLMKYYSMIMVWITATKKWGWVYFKIAYAIISKNILNEL